MTHDLVQQVEDFSRQGYSRVRELIIYGEYADVAKAQVRLDQKEIYGQKVTCHVFAETDVTNKYKYGLKVQFNRQHA